MNVKEQLMQQGVKVLKVVYPLLILCVIYVGILLITGISVISMLLKHS